MARKDFDFKPDPSGTGILSKLYLTPRQRQTGLKWLLFALVCVVALVIQASLFSRVTIFGGWLDLAPALIVLICIVQGPVSGSVFALAGSLIYVFSGSAPGTYAIAFITVYASLAAAFRQSYLRRSFSSAWLCAAVAMMLYELSVFAMGMFWGLTYLSRIRVFAMTGGLSILVMPLVYPLLGWIGKIGGETWKE